MTYYAEAEVDGKLETATVKARGEAEARRKVKEKLEKKDAAGNPLPFAILTIHPHQENTLPW